MASSGHNTWRRRQIRVTGSGETFTSAQIGERDSWICGICQDSARLVNPNYDAPRALSPSMDHIVPLSADGAHTKVNVRIAHLWCNVERNSGTWHGPEFMRARLTQVLEGTPIPEQLYRRDRADLSARVTSRRTTLSLPTLTARHAARTADSEQEPGRARRLELIITIKIAAGQIAPDPRYGDPAVRQDAARRQIGEVRWNEALATQRRIRSKADIWWRASKSGP
jgi:hypothetical protein